MIPPVAHFVWLGQSFPWMFGVALHAAATRGGFSRVVLHHTDDLHWESIGNSKRELASAELRKLRPDALLGKLGQVGRKLLEIWPRLAQPAARSNVLRLAILACEGGVYLDTDVITVRSFLPLLEAGIFCGSERIALPANVVRSRNPLRWLAALGRVVARDGLRRLPNGHRWFRHIERAYPAVVNNAVLGAEPGHPFLYRLLEGMVQLPASRQTARYALGTHLLEDFVRLQAPPDLVVHPPQVFYPLAPEISQHWFRLRASPRLEDGLRPETVAVHWYASVRTRELLSRIDADHVRSHCHRQLWSALVRPLLTPDTADTLDAA